jgi:hypothetical protein
MGGTMASANAVQDACFAVRKAIKQRDPELFERATKSMTNWRHGTAEYELKLDLIAIHDVLWALGCGSVPHLENLRRVEALFIREGVDMVSQSPEAPD